jgi:PAS domain S-box-containing protein
MQCGQPIGPPAHAAPAPGSSALDAAAALRQSEARYRTLVESSVDVVYTLAPDGTITALNAAFEAITGCSRAEWVGQPFAGLVHPDDLPATAESIARALAGEELPLLQVRIRTSAGPYRVGEYSLRPRVEGGTVVELFGFARDVTERRRAEDALREARQHEARLEGVTLAARELAHLLNNNLALAVGALELIQDRVALPAELQRLVVDASATLDVAVSHIRQFQQVVRVETKQTPVGPALDLERSVEGYMQREEVAGTPSVPS